MKTFNSNELINEQYYKFFRSDRSTDDKLKDGENGGGGVVILCRQDLDVTTRLISIKTELPIISLELIFKDKSKLLLSTFYSYGYSDLEAYLETERYYRAMQERE